ncbi:rhodanese-like domain-containing protein [Flavobacterium gelidilacus]|uniref:rhodanese-like domain-containing protein n=1 Tax=Flavobacterium gelidilacus TaxID=206041 RepID=UPI0003FE522F|nr:rhodanese-like domain-containing protein [Flavobacterium gelidilacus]
METIKIKEVCPTSTLELIKRNYLLLDVREENEFNQFSFDVPRVLNIPMSQLTERMNEIPKDEKVILACLTGERSLRAVQFLNEYGFTNLLNMKKGLSKWAQKEYPIKGESIVQEKLCCGEHSNCK